MHTLWIKRVLQVASWSAVLIWMAVIFLFSAQPAYESDSLSQGVSRFVFHLAEQVVPSIDPDVSMTTLNYLVRKVAHFTIYFILSLLTINALRASGIKGPKAVVWTLVMCIIYAASDEIHQAFVPSRDARLKDVLIDSAGAAVGICLYSGILKCSRGH